MMMNKSTKTTIAVAIACAAGANARRLNADDGSTCINTSTPKDFIRMWDLELGETRHLVVGWTAIALMGIGGLLTRAFTRNPWLRSVHPWIGIAAVVLALAQGVLGIELLP